MIDIETRYIDPETGKLLSSRDFLHKLALKLPSLYSDETELRKIWADPDTRTALLSHLSSLGIGDDQIEDLTRMFEAEDSDIFDILAHLSFGSPIHYRAERRSFAEDIVTQYDSLTAQAFIDFLLSLYVRNGIRDFGPGDLSTKIKLFAQGTTSDLAKAFGGNKALREAYYRVQESLYSK